MLLHEYMKKFRKKYNLTQSDLARELGVSSEQIGLWETRKQFPDASQKQKILNYFDAKSKGVADFDAPLKIPFLFGKPRSLKPVIFSTTIPLLAFFIALVNTTWSSLERWIFVLIGISNIFLISIVSPFDFKTYYSYFGVYEDYIDVDDTRGFIALIKTIKGIFGNRKSIHIPYDDIKSMEIMFDTHGHGSIQGLDHRRRQMYRNREFFVINMATYEGKTYQLNLDRTFYKDDLERHCFNAMFDYFEEKGITVSDPKMIRYSFENHEDFVINAYKTVGKNVH
ncbi:MAG: helix-turn-helix transcriptional regulator [Erysipelothrix sp.]